jgi:hypothetical protein
MDLKRNYKGLKSNGVKRNLIILLPKHSFNEENHEQEGIKQ